MATASASRRPRLDRERIVEQALQLAHAEGLASLTMRRIASGLGVDVAALYWHFQNKDALLAAVGAAAAERAELPAPGSGSWRERCLRTCEAIRERLRELPELAIHGDVSPWLAPFNARALGAIASVVEDAGLDEADTLYASQALLHLVTAVASSETAITRASGREEVRRYVRSVTEALPEATARAYHELARLEPDESLDAYFSFTIGALLDGIEKRRPPT